MIIKTYRMLCISLFFSLLLGITGAEAMEKHPRPAQEEEQGLVDRLRSAIAIGDTYQVSILLEKHVSPDIDIYGKPALLYAAHLWQEQPNSLVYRHLFELLAAQVKNISPEHLGVILTSLAGDQSPMAYKALEILVPLVAQVGLIDAREPMQGATALLRAAQAGNSAAVKLLASHGAAANATDKQGLAPLDYVAVSALIEWGAGWISSPATPPQPGVPASPTSEQLGIGRFHAPHGGTNSPWG
jgi:ankyrin repeat protein